jgi:hypothetical protein
MARIIGLVGCLIVVLTCAVCLGDGDVNEIFARRILPLA